MEYQTKLPIILISYIVSWVVPTNQNDKRVRPELEGKERISLDVNTLFTQGMKKVSLPDTTI